MNITIKTKDVEIVYSDSEKYITEYVVNNLVRLMRATFEEQNKRDAMLKSQELGTQTIPYSGHGTLNMSPSESHGTATCTFKQNTKAEI